MLSGLYGVCGAIGLCALAVGRAADAAPRAVALTYVRETGAEDCPDERWFRQSVTSRLGANPFREDAATKIEARLSSSSQGLVGTIQFQGPDGEPKGRREFRSAKADCLELASAMELAVAIAVDPHAPMLAPPAAEAAAPTEPAAPEPLQTSAPAPLHPLSDSPPEPSPPPSPPVSPPVRAWRLVPEVSLFGSAGLSPRPTAGASVGARVRWPRFSFGVEGRADLAGRVPGDGGQVTSSVLLASLTPCLHLGAVAACGVGSAGALQVSGDFEAGQRRSTPLLLAGVRAQVGYPLSPVISVFALGELQAVLTRTTVLSGTRPLWVTSPVTGAVGAGAALHFF